MNAGYSPSARMGNRGTHITDPRSQRIRASRRGGQITTSSSQLMSVRRPARTLRAPGAPWPGSAEASSLNNLRNGEPARIRPDNAFAESFNGKFRAECLNQHWFMSLDDAVRNARLGAETTMRCDPIVPSATSRRYRW